MIKYLILFIHLIGLSIYQMFFGDVTATQNLPSNIKSGEEVVVEITINKDGVGGFAKVQQTLPQGFVAEVVDSKGATFSFKDNIVKFIWMALPSENEFKVTYKLKTTESTTGDFTIGGKFSFIDNNERKNIEIKESLVKVSAEEMASNEEPEEEPIIENNEEPSTVADVIEEPVEEVITEVVEEEPKEVINTSNEVQISAVRDVVEKEGNYLVSVKFTQQNLEGFAKIVEKIPAGFDAEAVESKGGVFSFKDNEAKILWMAAPSDKEFEISYILKPTTSKSGSHDINGEFSYLENDITQKYLINSSSFNIDETASENEVVAAKNTSEEVAVEELPIEEEIIAEEPVQENTSSSNELVNKITSTPNPQTGVSYKVQVGAGHQSVSSNYFAKRFNLNDNISTESHEGWIKYVTGNFNIYKEARDKRNVVRNKVKNAFVTAYNQGQRITVQEALMISNQKWYK